MKSNLVDIACEIKVETKAAYLIDDGIKEAWLPKSQVELDFQHGKATVVTVPEWLAKEKGLI